MFLVYNEDPVKGVPGGFDPLRCDATKIYLEHYSNSLYLSFMIENGNMEERTQAAKEMAICERKMKYWSRQPHFNEERANTERMTLKRQWSKE